MFQNHGSKFALIAAIVGLFLWLGWKGPEGPFQPNRGLDLQGGAELIYELAGITTADRQTSIDVIRRRLDAFGMREMVIRPSGQTDFLVQLPGVDKTQVEQIDTAITTSGKMDFKIVEDEMPVEERERTIAETQRKKRAGTYVEENERFDIARNQPLPKAELDAVPDEGRKWDGEPGDFLLLENHHAINGKDLARAYPTRTPDHFGPVIGFEFSDAAKHRFKQLTGENVGRRLAVTLDGIVQTAPTIKSEIYGSGVIEGEYTDEEVRNMVVVLKGGSLATRPRRKSLYSVGPNLGKESIKAGTTASVLALFLVVAFMAVYYLATGIVSAIALLLNLFLLVAVMVVFEATLTLPGIAGVVLTLGMAVDANILINERIREEKGKGKTIRQAVQNGYDRAFWTIFDSNLTTIITAVILYYLGTGPVKGFAVTLNIGILISMFTALFVTRAFTGWLVARGTITEARMLRIFPETPSFQFIGRQRGFVLASTIVFLLSILAFASRGQEKYGIDFTGGALVQARFREPMSKRAVEEAVKGARDVYAQVEVQTIETPEADAIPAEERAERSDEFQIRTRLLATSAEAAGETRNTAEVFQRDVERVFEGRLAPPGFPPHDVPESDGHARLVFHVNVWEHAATPLDPRTVKGHVVVGVASGGRVERSPFPATDQPLWTEATVAIGEKVGYYRTITITTGPLPDREMAERLAVSLQKFFRDDTRYTVAEAFSRVEEIQASVAADLLAKAVWAVVFACVAIVLYLAFRFEFGFGVAAVIALVHDVVIAMGVLTVCDQLGWTMKIDLPVVASFLTIVGFSVNDTIVTFDRVRENIGLHRRMPFAEICNLSINQVLSRTLLTTGTSLLAVAALLLCGVESIRGFTFAMFVGMIVGTYSSIFIATPIAIWLRERNARQAQKAKERPSQDPAKA